MKQNNKSRIIETGVPDIYWGEFDETELDQTIEKMRVGDYEKARRFVREDIKREGFIFGQARSDFIYYLDLIKDSVVLDTGCGLGTHTFNIAPLVSQVHSFDLSKKRLEFCELRKQHEKISNIALYHADFEHLPFKDSTFDAIIMNGVVEWLGEAKKHKNPREDQLDVLRDMYRKLKPGGQLYIGIENRFAAAYLTSGYDHSGLKFTSLMPRWLANLTMRIRKGRSYRTYTYSMRGYKKLIKDAGFDLKKTNFYIAMPGYNRPKYIIPFNDIEALRFFLRLRAKSKGLKGGLMRFIASSKLLTKLSRYTFFSYLIYARK